jgi:2-hydroxy-6-oxonona-2,4-dienedioate hydrolase
MGIRVRPLLLACAAALACAPTKYGTAPWRPPAYYDVEHFTEIDGLRICYLEAGTDKPEAIVFVHGWSGNVHNYWAQYEHFARDYHVLVYDQPGHGKSERAPGVEWDIERYGNTLVAMLDERGIERATIVANSAGGSIALWVALRHPERFERLVLSNSTGSGRNGATTSILHTVTAWGLRNFDLSTGKRYVGDDERTRTKREFIGSFYGTVEEKPYLQMLARSLNDLYHRFRPREIAELEMPILIIWSDHDPVLGQAPRRWFDRHLPEAKKYVIQDGGHTPMQKKPDEFNCIVARFIRGETLEECRPPAKQAKPQKEER